MSPVSRASRSEKGLRYGSVNKYVKADNKRWKDALEA
jgi:hypothetical protein